ncbi:hypothetical protein HII31_07206 [Pseudocercospora fuligena]|uniref:Uncharacterized protein n=1 Tax=Pseudocercospora fuligena TaxID=685502 RepID=A0A8H6RIN8_9PEZI|nr:hypothetical protein HII31_07206 [Pseudocercospora fuligena]
MFDTPDTLDWLDLVATVFSIIWLICSIINIYELRKYKKENRDLRLQIDEYKLDIKRRDRLDKFSYDAARIDLYGTNDLKRGVPQETTPLFLRQLDGTDYPDSDRMQVHTFL